MEHAFAYLQSQYLGFADYEALISTTIVKINVMADIRDYLLLFVY